MLFFVGILEFVGAATLVSRFSSTGDAIEMGRVTGGPAFFLGNSLGGSAGLDNKSRVV